jgi:uncharacterized protein (TIGR02453 family)
MFRRVARLSFRDARFGHTICWVKRFQGFSDGDGKFFKALAKNQNREWFQAHKDEYQRGWHEPMQALLEDLRDGVDPAYEHSELGEPKVFRIFRDVRFSKDKSPYKTFVAGVLPMKRTAKVTETPAAVYMHFGTDNVIASGLYMMDGPSLARYRAAVADEARGKEVTKILGKLEKAGFSVAAMSEGTLKRVPKGFDPEHPRADLLKRKSLGVAFPASARGQLASPEFGPWLVQNARKVVPLVEWLLFATA